MAQKVINNAIGLRSFKNELTLPDGSLITANSVVIDRDNVIESRRGFSLYGSFATTSDRSKQLLQYKNTILNHYGSTLMYDNGSGTLTAFSGTYNELESGLRIKGIETSGNFYFTTDEGVKKISASSSADFTASSGFITDSGSPNGLDGQGTANIGTPGFMTTQTATAYRVVWGYKDPNSNLVLGAPSEYFVVRNADTVSSAVVDLEFTIPSEILNVTKWFYQVYRSPLVADPSGTATPEDEMNLVFEDFPSSSDFSNGYVTVTDINN